MKITRRQLRNVIKEVTSRLHEVQVGQGDDPSTLDADDLMATAAELKSGDSDAVTVQSMIDRYKGDPRGWMRVRNEFFYMAEGDDPDGIRMYYPGWTNQHFIDVIVGVDGNYDADNY
jgi:hypothetical protein